VGEFLVFIVGIKVDYRQMRRGRRALLIVAGCVLLACAVWVVWPGQKEPEYQGKKLSEWLYLYVVTHGADEGAAAAVREIGTNGLPWLMRGISIEPGKWRQVVAKLPGPFNRVAWFKDGLMERAEAVGGFRILRYVASP